MELVKCLECGALTDGDYGMTDVAHSDWHKEQNAKLAELTALIKGENK